MTAFNATTDEKNSNSIQKFKKKKEKHWARMASAKWWVQRGDKKFKNKKAF